MILDEINKYTLEIWCHVLSAIGFASKPESERDGADIDSPTSEEPERKMLDVVISYRRSNGSQLARYGISMSCACVMKVVYLSIYIVIIIHWFMFVLVVSLTTR